MFVLSLFDENDSGKRNARHNGNNAAAAKPSKSAVTENEQQLSYDGGRMIEITAIAGTQSPNDDVVHQKQQEQMSVSFCGCGSWLTFSSCFFCCSRMNNLPKNGNFEN